MNDVILITGGSSGYGLATAARFVREGERVIITGRNEGKLAQAAKETGADAFRADATDPADWDRLVQYVKEKYCRLDLLVNNAGGGVAIKETVSQSVEDVDRTIKLNLNSVIYGCRAFAPMLIAQGSGTVVNVSSICARHAWPGWTVYAAAKWGVLGFTKGLTTELGPHGIRVSCILPGAGDTNFDRAANFTERGMIPDMKGDDIAAAIVDLYRMPKHIWVEEVTVWGMDQIISPL